MTANTQFRSLLQEVLDVYDSWSAQFIVYIATSVVSLGAAIFLDLGLGTPPVRVLMYVLPLTAASLLLLPGIFFALRRSTFIRTFLESVEVEAAVDNHRIMIIEDDERVRSLLMNALGDKYECAAVESAEHALVALTESYFDLVIIDIEMTGSSGLQRRLHSISPDSLFLVVSRKINIDAAIASVPGLILFMGKRFDIPALEDNVKRALKRSALLQGKPLHKEHLG